MNAPSKDAPDAVERPHLVWWVLVLGGLTLLAFQAWHAPFYAWWTDHVNPLPGQSVMMWIFIACIPIHIFEAVYVYRLAHKLGMPRSAVAWSVQTLALGFPSTRLMLRRKKRIVPGPKGKFLLGNTLEFQRQPLDFCLRQKALHGDVLRFNVALGDWYLIGDPEHIYRVLVADASSFNKPKLAKRLWRPFLGDGLLASDGEFWKRQHKLVQPGFHKARIEAYAEVMVRFTESMLAEWKDGERRDMCSAMTDLTLAIVAKTLFDADVHGDARRVGKAIEVVNEVLCAHIAKPIPVPRWWPSAANKKKVKALDEIRTIVAGIIAERRASGEDRGDLLSTLVFAEDDSGKRMSDSELHDEAMTLFFAGHETTSVALTWMWYLLARHPEAETRLYDELQSVLGSRAITVGDLPNLPYLDMVVKESMRILPSVWSYMREPTRDYALGDYVIPKGSIVFICAYAVHHDARLFPDPEEFRPERFSKENEKKIPRGAYVPFAAGPRVCLGKNFALMEARLVLGTLVQHARARVPAGFEAKLLPQLSLRPEGGLPIEVELRRTSAAASGAPAASGTSGPLRETA